MYLFSIVYQVTELREDKVQIAKISKARDHKGTEYNSDETIVQ